MKKYYKVRKLGIPRAPSTIHSHFIQFLEKARQDGRKFS